MQGGYMLYQNWADICEIENPLMRLALGTLNPQNNSEDELFAEANRCYFLQRRQKGPIPLSVLRHVAREKEVKEVGREEADGNFLVSDGACARFKIPIFRYANTEAEAQAEGIEVLPAELAKKVLDLELEYGQIGDVIEFKGKKLVVVENNILTKDDDSTISFAPFERIALDK